jgi:hypothetical protein
LSAVVPMRCFACLSSSRIFSTTFAICIMALWSPHTHTHTHTHTHCPFPLLLSCALAARSVVVEGPPETEVSLSSEPVVVETHPVEPQPADADEAKPKGPFSYASAIAKKVPVAPQPAKPVGTRTAQPPRAAKPATAASPNAGEGESPSDAAGGDDAAARAAPRNAQVRSIQLRSLAVSSLTYSLISHTSSNCSPTQRHALTYSLVHSLKSLAHSLVRSIQFNSVQLNST